MNNLSKTVSCSRYQDASVLCREGTLVTNYESMIVCECKPVFVTGEMGKKFTHLLANKKLIELGDHLQHFVVFWLLTKVKGISSLQTAKQAGYY